MAATITDLQQVPVSIAITDAEGNPATVQGAPTWESSDTNVATVTPADDGLSAVISSVEGGALGSATVTVRADADLGDGVKEITGEILVDVIASDATGVVLTPGTPEDRPQP